MWWWSSRLGVDHMTLRSTTGKLEGEIGKLSFVESKSAFSKRVMQRTLHSRAIGIHFRWHVKVMNPWMGRLNLKNFFQFLNKLTEILQNSGFCWSILSVIHSSRGHSSPTLEVDLVPRAVGGSSNPSLRLVWCLVLLTEKPPDHDQPTGNVSCGVWW